MKTSGNSLSINSINSKNNLNVNDSLSSSMIISNNTSSKKNILKDKDVKSKKIVDNSKNLKEEYRKILKDKNYSRSIDGNIPKHKYVNYQNYNVKTTAIDNSINNASINGKIVNLKNKK